MSGASEGGRARLNRVGPKTKRRKDVQRVGMTKMGLCG